MQKRVEPAALALLASSITSKVFMVGEGLTKVLALEDWEQYLQSSTQPPVLMERSVHCCTSRALKYSRSRHIILQKI